MSFTPFHTTYPIMFKFLKNNFREICLCLFVGLIFVLTNYGIQQFLPEAGAIDPSIFSVLAASLMKAAACCLFVYLLVHVFAPTIAEFMDSGAFKHAFKAQDPLTKLRSSGIVIMVLTTVVLGCVLFG